MMQEKITCFKDHDDDKHIAYEHIAYSKFGKDYF